MLRRLAGSAVYLVTMLYHYTSLLAFESIVASGTLRAYDYRNLKGDATELSLGINRLRAFLETHPVVEDDKPYKRHLLEVVEKFASPDLPVFVTCFTEEADSAYHWSKYGPEGLAIGFDPVIKSGFPVNGKPYPGHRFMRCRYEEADDVAGAIENRFFAPNSYSAAYRNRFARDSGVLDATLAVSVYQTICTLKGERHVEDREYRCVVISPDGNHPIRTSPGHNPFIELQFEPLDFVREVVVGNHAKQEACKAAIKRFEDGNRLRLNHSAA